MKKLLILGPIGDFGGREIEVNIISKALKNDFEVTLFSTGYMTEKSSALQGMSNINWSCTLKNLVNDNFILSLFSKISKIINKGNLNYEAYLSNTISNFFFNVNYLIWQEIEKQLKNTDVVILCVQLTSNFLPQIVEFCHLNNVKCLVRTTGTIGEIDLTTFDFLHQVDLFIHHSAKNANNLNTQILLPYVIIDQCALNEKSLLNLVHQPTSNLRYGYIGRISEEKGIAEVADFFANKNYNFIIAGEGPQECKVQEIIKNCAYCSYIGAIENDKICNFFNQIDVLVISSYEESGPLVGLEAMAAGKLIISTNVGAMEDRLKYLKSFWFIREDLSSLQNCINEIESMSAEELRIYSSANRLKYQKEYSFHAISLKFLDVLSSKIDICE